MSNNAINPKLSLYQDIYSNEGYSSETHMSRAFLTKSTELSPIVTHLYYTSKWGSKNFPLSFMTEGMGKSKSIPSVEYTQNVMGKPKKTSTVAVTNSQSNAGAGYSPFTITFADRLFHKSLVIVSSNSNIQARIKSDPKRVGSYWEYTVQLTTDSVSAYCPVKHLTAGAKWGRLISKVGIESSKGVESRSYAPGKMKNQLSIVRDTFKIAGNVENKVAVVQIKTDAGIQKYWTQWELYLRQLEWKEKCEADLWYSRYNMDANGVIHDLDEDSGEVVPQGAGVIQQIPNEDTYSILTEAKLKNTVRDVFFGASDATERMVEVYTGTGGMTEVDTALKSASSGYTLVDSKFVTGSGNNLEFGSYFKTYNHIDGHTVKFTKLPMMDDGPIAQASDRNPISGLPTESHNFYFLDNSTYEGEANIKYVTETGRENIEFIVAGAQVPKGYGDNKFRSSDVDASSIQWMKSQGVLIRRPTNCFKLINELV